MIDPAPDAFIAGVPKCATSWLHQVLDEHPDICASRPKEPDYVAVLSGSVLSSPGTRKWTFTTSDGYATAFTHRQPGQVVVDGSVALSYSPNGPETVRKLCGPDTRLVFMYREPVRRLWSHIWAAWRASDATRPSYDFRRTLEKHRGYVDIGRFHEYVRPWLDAGFPTRHVFDFELRKDPEKLVRGVYRFLGVRPYNPPSLHRRVNQAWHQTRFHAWANGPLKDFLDRRAQPARRLAVRLGAGKAIDRLGMRKGSNPPVPRHWRRQAYDYYRDSVDALEGLLGADLSPWRTQRAHDQEVPQG